MPANPLRSIPSVNELLENPRLRKLVDRISHNAVVTTVGSVLDEVRGEVQNAAAEKTLPSVSELADRIVRRVMETQESKIQPVINATGVLLHPELGGPPLADEAVRAIDAVARDYAAVDLEFSGGQRSSPQAAVARLLTEITGAEAATVLASKTGAMMLVSSVLSAGREMVVSRGQLIASEDGSRLSDLTSAGGALIREVGAANVTVPRDYEEAVGSKTGALLLVQQSSFSMVGFSRSVALKELVEIGRSRDVPVIHDLGYGGLLDLADLGFSGEPSAAQSILSGADLVLVDGAKLLGGPPCGIVLGRRSLVEKVERDKTACTLEVGSLLLAALEATLRLSTDIQTAQRGIPLLGLLGTSVENLRNRAGRLAPQLAASPAVAEANPQPGTTFLAGNPVPSHELPTCSIAVKPDGRSPERLAASLRSSTPPVLGRVEDDKLLVDLRSVLPRQDEKLVAVFNGLGSDQ